MGYTSIHHEYRTDIIVTWYSRSPCQHLKGNWLEEAGFTTDTPFTVTVEHG
ncbi:SymE family type I addiction module toxin [Erwinia sp. S43]|uniref:SymE family type I addiction module toxin n=1 Tax=Erwinia sp. S43 TaxID=2769339 RepID=UPI00351CB680